ncbi:hypothetical protein CGMCC3_g8530 [Colletotrichum fructicola]|nr:uncharacterized protein CGMCC3_g8530 [Colletotrichum fructicola]KAE9575252.1 hypothetical protein CGMCC3_g8530 [Colletotrichum fructicola]
MVSSEEEEKEEGRKHWTVCWTERAQLHPLHQHCTTINAQTADGNGVSRTARALASPSPSSSLCRC